MLFKDCKFGDTVKIISGLENGCLGGFNKVGTIINKQLFQTLNNIEKSGWILSCHNIEEIGFLLTKDNVVWNVNNNCTVELLNKLDSKENIKENDMEIFKFKIEDYKVYDNKTVIVTFEDKTQEKAVCFDTDTFDLERGIEVCVLKHIFGADGYKSILKYANKQIKSIDKAKEDEKKLKELIAQKKAKAARKKAKRREKQRQNRIDEMREAYLKAMIEHDSYMEKYFYTDDCK